MKILVSGSLAYDRIMDFPGYFKDHILPDKIHNLNVSFFISKLNENFGGTAGNISYNLALLGEKPIIFSAVGNDFARYKKWLEKHGVDLSKIKIIKNERTAFANMITDQADNQISAFCPGAMANPCLIKYDKSYKNSLAIIAPGLVKDMTRLVKFYDKRGISYIFDPGQAIPLLSANNLKEGIRKAKAFIFNDYELSMVTKKTCWEKSDILENVEILATTLGNKGSIIKTRGKTYKIPPAKPKSTIDPTGAGDAWRAGFIKGLIEDWPLEVVGRFASVAACYAVENYGTQTHWFDFKEVKKRYRENYEEGLPE